jgi:hypothetical protein
VTEEWGPWVEHDGAEVRSRIPAHAVIAIRLGAKGIEPPYFKGISHNWPGFFWRIKRVKTGWFSSEWRPVCDDPAYAPIIAYRIRKPRGLVMLENLIAELPEPVGPKVDA